MSRLRKIVKNRPLLWLVLLVVLFATAAAVYAVVLPAISLDSPTSFPVDI